MLINPLIPLFVGVIFFLGYLSEKDQIFKWFWFAISLAFITTSFFVNVDLDHTNTLTALNGTITTTYYYAPDSSLQGLGNAFGILALVTFVLVAVRMLWTWWATHG